MEENNLEKTLGFFISFFVDIVVLILGYAFIPKKFEFSMLGDNPEQCILAVALIAIHIILFAVMIKLMIGYIENMKFYESSKYEIKFLIAKIVALIIDLFITIFILKTVIAFVVGFGLLLLIVYCILTS